MTERERLLDLIDYVQNGKQDIPFGGGTFRKELADYLLANGVIAPPYKVGDTVYWYDMGGNLREARVVRNGFTAKVKDGFEYHISYDKIGKTVFLTKEEAEQALRKEDEGK